jgi:hypothetical protein
MEKSQENWHFQFIKGHNSVKKKWHNSLKNNAYVLKLNFDLQLFKTNFI